MEKEAIKSKLKIILKAGNQIVAEVEDSILWQKVLAAINRGSAEGLDLKKDDVTEFNQNDDTGNTGRNGSLVKGFASILEVDIDKLKGACDPISEEPFIHIDEKTWANWRKRIPVKGRDAVSAIGIVATILALWFRQLKKGNVLYTHVKRVIDDLGIRYSNPTRAIKNCAWLQLRGKDQIRLNPSEIDKAIENVRTFVNKEIIKK